MHELHREVVASLAHSRVMDAHDPGVLELAGDLRLPVELPLTLGFGGQVGPDLLERHAPFQLTVPGLEDLAKTSRAVQAYLAKPRLDRIVLRVAPQYPECIDQCRVALSREPSRVDSLASTEVRTVSRRPSAVNANATISTSASSVSLLPLPSTRS